MAQYKGPASESQRVMQLQKKRELHQEEIEFKKKKLTEELKFDKMESKFSAHYDAVETNLKVKWDDKTWNLFQSQIDILERHRWIADHGRDEGQAAGGRQ